MITGDFVNGLHLMEGKNADMDNGAPKVTATSENTFFMNWESGKVYAFSGGTWTEADDNVAGLVAALLNKGALPAVTTSDNGKVLGVKNGVWGKMDAPSGLPDVTDADDGKVLGVKNGQWGAALGKDLIPNISMINMPDSVGNAVFSAMSAAIADIVANSKQESTFYKFSGNSETSGFIESALDTLAADKLPWGLGTPSGANFVAQGVSFFTTVGVNILTVATTTTIQQIGGDVVWFDVTVRYAYVANVGTVVVTVKKLDLQSA